jgi:hypothetical protein
MICTSNLTCVAPIVHHLRPPNRELNAYVDFVKLVDTGLHPIKTLAKLLIF